MQSSIVSTLSYKRIITVSMYKYYPSTRAFIGISLKFFISNHKVCAMCMAPNVHLLCTVN